MIETINKILSGFCLVTISAGCAPDLTSTPQATQIPPQNQISQTQENSYPFKFSAHSPDSPTAFISQTPSPSETRRISPTSLPSETLLPARERLKIDTLTPTPTSTFTPEPTPTATYLPIRRTTNFNNPNFVVLTIDGDMTNQMLTSTIQKGTRWYDPAVTDFLLASQIPFTFFATGEFVQAYPAYIANLAKHPDLVTFGNHTYNHAAPYPGCSGLPYLFPGDIINGIAQTQNIIYQATGQWPRYFRYPGLCEDPGISWSVAQMGMMITGGIASEDAFYKGTPQSLAKHAADQSYLGPIMIFHPGAQNAPQTAAAMPLFVNFERSQGKTFVPLSSLFPN